MTTLYLWLLAFLPSAATFGVAPVACLLPRPEKSSARHAPAVLLKKSRYTKSTFVKENVDPEALEYTKRRIFIANVAASVPILLALASGKTVDQYNAPGYAEAARVKAEKKKAFIASEQARKDALAARAAADKAAGRPATPPPKPWERGSL